MKRKKIRIKLFTEEEKDDFYKKNGLRKKTPVKYSEDVNEEEEEEEEEEDQEDNDKIESKRSRRSEEKEEDTSRKSGLRKKTPVKYTEDGNEEEEEEEEEDNEQPGPSRKNTHNQRTQEKRLFPVTCGNKKGILDKEKLERSEKCIKCESRWFSPPAFEEFGGKGSSKKWKATIFYEDKPLQVLFEKGLLTTKGYKRRGSETTKQKKIVSPHCESKSSSEESEMQSSEETEEDDVKDDDSEELVLETEEGEEESVEAEDRVEVVDSGDDKSKEEEDKMEDEEDVADNDNLSSVFEERETRLNISSSEKSALQKKVKVIIPRLPEAQNGRQSNCTEHPVEDWCIPLDERAQSEEEGQENNDLQMDDPSITEARDVPRSAGGNGEEFMQSNKVKDRQREIKSDTGNSPTCLSATATSASDLKPDVVNRTDDAGSVNSHSASHSSSPALLVTETDTGLAGDIIEHVETAKSKASQPCTTVNIRDVTSSTVPMQREAKDEILQATSPSTNLSELVECKYENLGHTDASTSDPAQLVMGLQTRLLQTTQVEDSSHLLEMMEGPSPSPSNSTDLDAMDLDQLKREKIKRQIKVLKLQEEYYTLKIKDIKK